MFCKNCGKEISDSTRFCNFCGADQSKENTSTSTQVENSAPIQKKNNTLTLAIVAAVAVVAIVLGIFVIAPSLSDDGGKKTDTPVSEEPPQSVVLPSLDNEPVENNNNTQNTPAVSLVPAVLDATSDYFELNIGGGDVISVGVSYYTSSPEVVKTLEGKMIISKQNSAYADLKAEAEIFKGKADSLGDEFKAFIDIEETSTGIEISYSFNQLADADRLERVELAADFIGINDTDGAFYHDDIVQQLTSLGFEG